MTELERHELAAALVHGVPGATLTLRCERGEEVVVGRHPGADLTPCALRRIVVDAGRRVAARAPLARVADLRLGGATEDLGGGVVATRTPCGLEQRWIATTLGWDDVVDVLERTAPDDDHDDGLEASLRPDPELGVTVVAITALDRRALHLLDRLAGDVAGACMTEELIRSCTAPTDLPHTPQEGR